MQYTESQIARAKSAYGQFLSLRSIESYDPEHIGYNEAEQRCNYHNAIVNGIMSGDKALEREWKNYFLMEVLKADAAANRQAQKLAANKAASADILAPIKAAKKLVAFGQWLNTAGNPFRSQHFSKKYTAEAVAAFLAI